MMNECSTVSGYSKTFAAMNAPPNKRAISTKMLAQWVFIIFDKHTYKKGYIDCATIFTLSDACMTKSRSEKHHFPHIPYLKKFTDDKVYRNMLK